MHLAGNRQDAEDLYQETWLKAYRGYATYRDAEPFEAWLAAICANAYRDGLRYRKKRPVFDAFATSDEKDRTLERAASPERTDYSDLTAAVNRLKERYRTVVVLHYFLDKSVEKTAQTLKLPVGTVKSRLKRARETLKEMLGD